MVGASVLALSRVLTPELGIEGPALGTAIPFFLAFPLLLRGWRRLRCCSARIARWALLPAYALARRWRA
jgi:O-antigen/teichoic acid export membrane protein